MLLVPGDGGFDAAGVVAVDGDGVVAKLLSISFEEGIGLGRLMLETFEKIKINYFIFFQQASGQSYKASMIVIYGSRVITMSNLLVITTVES